MKSWRFVMQTKSLQKLAPRKARWHGHVNHVQAPVALQHWLNDRGSLTAKLISHSTRFRVQRIAQQTELCWADEYAAIGLTTIAQTHTREVLLRCNDRPVVYAHTIMPLSSTASQWPLFRTLGNQSLGSTLFSDPQVIRGALEFARLAPNHPAMKRAKALTQHEDNDDDDDDDFSRPLFARRSLFYRCGGVMLVTELFLASIEQLTLKRL